MGIDYSRRKQEELNRYSEVENIHNLPSIYHYWSNKFLLPIVISLGHSVASDIYLHHMRNACLNKSASNAKFLSIGTGNCELEVLLATRLYSEGITNFTLDCLDFNQAMLARGKKLSEEKDVSKFLCFKEVDINQWKANEEYDAILAVQCLHHFVELESIFDKVYDCLARDGFFVVHDMIGRNGHLRWPETLKFIQQLWTELPESHKYNHQFERHEQEFSDWDCSVTGFEGIRAQDILPLLVEKFQFEMFAGWGGIIDVFVDRGFGHNFDPNKEWDRSFIDVVSELNNAKLLDSSIKPTQMFATMSKTKPNNPQYWQNRSPENSIRWPLS